MHANECHRVPWTRPLPLWMTLYRRATRAVVLEMRAFAYAVHAMAESWKEEPNPRESRDGIPLVMVEGRTRYVVDTPLSVVRRKEEEE